MTSVTSKSLRGQNTTEVPGWAHKIRPIKMKLNWIPCRPIIYLKGINHAHIYWYMILRGFSQVKCFQTSVATIINFHGVSHTPFNIEVNKFVNLITKKNIMCLNSSQRCSLHVASISMLAGYISSLA